MEVGSKMGVLDQPHGVANQFDINVLLNFGTRAGQISEQVGDDHALMVRYEGLHDIGRKIDPISVLGNHVYVLPD